jgi:hypothetical protein
MRTTTSSIISKGFMVLASTSVVFGTATPSFAGSFTYTGTTVAGDTWHRPVANQNDVPVKLSPTTTAVTFSAFEFNVDTTGLYDFISTSTNPANWDNYTFLYANSFDPTQPLDNIIIANNDFPSQGLSGFNNVALTAGLNYFLVTSGFANTDQGAFTNTIANSSKIIAGPVTSVPTPALLPGLIAMGIATFRKQKQGVAD